VLGVRTRLHLAIGLVELADLIVTKPSHLPAVVRLPSVPQ
jgi:hypothetical protein